ncbi:unnamed protein product, partial [marine sediment metagenome]
MEDDKAKKLKKYLLLKRYLLLKYRIPQIIRRTIDGKEVIQGERS